jgi:hypothetical protein
MVPTLGPKLRLRLLPNGSAPALIGVKAARNAVETAASSG